MAGIQSELVECIFLASLTDGYGIKGNSLLLTVRQYGHLI